jgi:hypothetical protein
VWSMETGELQRILPQETSVSSVAQSSDGRGRVAQVGVTDTSLVGATYATWSSFPVEVGSVDVSSAMEASLR